MFILVIIIINNILVEPTNYFGYVDSTNINKNYILVSY